MHVLDLKFFLFIYDSHTHREREREREAETQEEGEAGSMHREPDVGLDPGSPGSRPGPKAGAKPLRHAGIPHYSFLKINMCFLYSLMPHDNLAMAAEVVVTAAAVGDCRHLKF